MLVHEFSVGAAETAAHPGRAAWVWQGCHTLLSVLCGQYAHPKLLWVPCIPWENTHPLGGKHKEGMAECHALLR